MTLIRFLSLTAAIALMMVTWACQLPAFDQNGGNLQLTFSTAELNTILPPISMEPVSYLIVGYGPFGDTFSTDTGETSIEIDELQIGEWTVVVSASNDAATIVGLGEATATVRTGEVASVPIRILPIDGTGTFDLSLSWDDLLVDIPTVDGNLLTFDSTNIVLDFDIGPGTAVHNSGLLDSGYYSLVVQLKDNGILVTGAVEIVRIVAGQITSGGFDFTNLNQPGGGIIVNITPELDDPIPVTMSGQLNEVPFGGSMTVDTSVPPEVGGVIVAWYINGIAKATGPSYVAGADLDPGYYRLDATAFSIDGRRGGSATATFEVLVP